MKVTKQLSAVENTRDIRLSCVVINERFVLELRQRFGRFVVTRLQAEVAPTCAGLVEEVLIEKHLDSKRIHVITTCHVYSRHNLKG
jgi:hypothetical protein